jgi:glycosyltransferase involved in cell wall biosynthesis
VVGSRIAGIDAAVVDGDSGLLVPPGDAGALAAALDGLLADPDRRAKLGAAAAARAEEFSVTAVGARYRALLRQVAFR